MKKSIFLIMSLFAVLNLFAQPEWENFQVNTTLFSPIKIKTIEIDENGNKWIGTEDRGILFFDGSLWRVYDTYNTPALRTNNINHLFFDSKWNLWISTSGGGLVIKNADNTWSVYTKENLPPNELPSDFVTYVTEDNNGAMWIATQEGVVYQPSDRNFYYFNMQNTAGFPSNRITSIQIQMVNNVSIKWIATENGLVRLDDSMPPARIQVFNTSSTPKIEGGNGIAHLIVDNLGRKWFHIYHPNTNEPRGLRMLNANNTEFTAFEAPALPSNTIRSITYEIDQSNNPIIWIATNNGIAQQTATGWQTISNTQNVLPTNDVWTIKIDRVRANAKWLGTQNRTMQLVSREGTATAWTRYSIANSGIPSNNIQTIAIDQNGNRWIGTAMGLTFFDGINYTVYNIDNSKLPSNNITSLVIDKENFLWIGTNRYMGMFGGLARYDLTIPENPEYDRWFIYKASDFSLLDSDDITKVVVGEDNSIWVATAGGGVFSISPTKQQSRYRKGGANSIISDKVNDIIIDHEGNKWMATDAGICMLAADNVNFPQNRMFNTNNGLPSNEIRRIKQDRNHFIWAITDVGLVKYNNRFWSAIIRPTALTGFDNTSITDIGFDSGNIKWITTRTGGLYRTNETNWSNYIMRDNPLLSSNNLNFVYIHENEKWMGTFDAGLSVFRGGNQIFDNTAYITVFQHNLIPNQIKISAIVNNAVVDTVFFEANRQRLSHTRLAPNNWLTDFVVGSSGDVNLSFRYIHEAGDSTITRRVNVALLNSPVYLGDGVKIQILNDTISNEWLVTEYFNENELSVYRIPNLKSNIKGKIAFVSDVGHQVQFRGLNSLSHDDWLPIQNNVITESGDYRIVGTDTMVPIQISNLSNYPNPFNPDTQISFFLNTDATKSKIEIYNLKGQKVKSLYSGALNQGSHRYIWDGRNDFKDTVASGIYFIRLEADTAVQTRKILLIK